MNRKYSVCVTDNLLNQQFNSTQVNQVWAGDVTYLRTHLDAPSDRDGLALQAHSELGNIKMHDRRVSLAGITNITNAT